MKYHSYMPFALAENAEQVLDALNRPSKNLLVLTHIDCDRCKEFLYYLQTDTKYQKNMENILSQGDFTGILVHSKGKGRFKTVVDYVKGFGNIRGLPFSGIYINGQEKQRIYGSFSSKGYASSEFDILEKVIEKSIHKI
jgi:hypothetical protein